MAFFYGTDGADDLSGTPGSDWLYGYGGDDHLYGGDGADWLVGGSGNDVLDGGANNIQNAEVDSVDYHDDPNGVSVDLSTGIAHDGFGGTDTLVNIEAIQESRFDDTLIGDGGQNWFWMGWGGTNTVDGGGDRDVVIYEFATSAVTVDLQAGTADYAGGHDTLLNIENLHGSDFDDVLTLSNVGGYVFGRAGNDHINGGNGNDYLIAGSGDDVVDGKGGYDLVAYTDDHFDIVGGSAPTTHGVYVNLQAGQAIDNWDGHDTLMNIEGVVGSDFSDTIIGDVSNNYIAGNLGDDSLYGGDGDDHFFDAGLGGAVDSSGSDPVGPGKGLGHVKDNGQGHLKFDNPDGPPGHAKHSGTPGTVSDNDTYTGGAGHDVFTFAGANGHDKILDFEAGNGWGDQIDLSLWGVHNFDETLALAHKSGHDTLLSLDANSSITLVGIKISDLAPDDFHYAPAA